MRPKLECLEDRVMPDAMLASAFVQYLAPEMVRSVNAMVSYHDRLAESIITMASSQAAVMGPQFAANNMPQVVAAAEAVIQQAPQLQLAVSAEITADYQVLLDAPPNPSEVLDIMLTVGMMASLDAQLTMSE